MTKNSWVLLEFGHRLAKYLDFANDQKNSSYSTKEKENWKDRKIVYKSILFEKWNKEKMQCVAKKSLSTLGVTMDKTVQTALPKFEGSYTNVDPDRKNNSRWQQESREFLFQLKYQPLLKESQPSKIAYSLHKNEVFHLLLSSVNLTECKVTRGFGHIYWKNS